MTHFVNPDGLNIFRLPVSWQYLTNNTLNSTLESINFSHYDQLVQSYLRTGATCMVDLHNYGRWNGSVIGGPNGPSDAQFINPWGQIAARRSRA